MKLYPLLLLLAGGAAAPADLTERELYDTKYEAWGWACELTVDCVGIRPPTVVLVNTSPGLRGYYEGGKKIFVSARLSGVDQMSTVIHEMIHYIHTQQGDLPTPFNPERICWSENQAFTLVDRWFDIIGKPQYKRGPNWWYSYWHCEPYYDPDWDLWEWIERGFF